MGQGRRLPLVQDLLEEEGRGQGDRCAFSHLLNLNEDVEGAVPKRHKDSSINPLIGGNRQSREPNPNFPALAVLLHFMG